MSNKRKLNGLSSLFVTKFGLCCSAAATAAAAVFHVPELFGLFFFLLMFGLFARLWGKYALKGLSVSLSADCQRLFPGQETTLSYSIRNDKLLPLIWLEFYQEFPPHRCILPESGFEVHTRSGMELEAGLEETVLQKRFAYLMGHSGAQWHSTWRARRRGIYPADSLTLRSGDGFGLTSSELLCRMEKHPTFVIYPALCPVDASLFLRSQWECASGRTGYLEDPSVLRGVRPYQSTDSWKRINWRLAARGQDLQVNQYETILPKTAHFILDGESFLNRSDDMRELEQVLEVMASILLTLDGQHIACSLTLPVSKTMPAVTRLTAPDCGAAELLELLAGYECAAERIGEKEPEGNEKPRYRPSQFRWAAFRRAVSASSPIYCWTYSPEDLLTPGSLPSGLDFSRLTLISYCEPEKELPGVRCVPLNSLRKGTGI